MKKTFIIVICTIAALILGYGIKYAVTPISSQELVRAGHENSVACAGYIVRDERAYYADRDGKLYKNVTVGSRVAKDSIIYTIYDSAVSDETIKELNTLDRKIADATEAKNTEAYSSVSISVETEIASRTAQIIEAGRNNDVNKIARYKKDINDLRTTGAVVSVSDTLEGLKSEKASIEASIGAAKSEAYAQNSGVFSMYHDGFEDILSKDKVEEYTVEYIESLGKSHSEENELERVQQNDFVCTVVNNHEWNVLLVVPTAELENHKVGDSVTIRFKNIANSMQAGIIRYISTEEQNKDDKSFILVECNDYFEGAFSYRSVDADLVFKSYSGYKVPASAVRKGENGYSIICISDNKEFVCKIDVLYADPNDEYVIVDSTDDAKYRMSNMDRIVVGER